MIVSLLHSMKVESALSIIILMVLLPAFSSVPAQTPAYDVIDLGALQQDNYSFARAINESGQVTGLGYITGGYKAFEFDDTSGIHNLGSPPGNNLSDGWDINDNGIIAGTGGADPYMYSPSDGWIFLGNLGGSGGEAHGINDAALITGFSNTNGFNDPHAFLYDPNNDPPSIIDLIPGNNLSYGRGINNMGQVTGYMLTGGYRAFRWASGNVEDLGVLAGMAHSFGYAINESGQVTGYCSSANGNAEKIFRYTDGVGMEDLGGLGEENAGWGINSRGDVVGRGNPGTGFAVAVLYTDENGLQDLNTLIDQSSGWFLSQAFDINDAGQIVGAGTDNFGHHHAVRLDPTATGTEPESDRLPDRLELGQNYPNPFNAQTAFDYNLPKEANVKIDIFDILGRKIETLVNSDQQPGQHRVVWDASAIPSGVYFYKLSSGDSSVIRKMELLK